VGRLGLSHRRRPLRGARDKLELTETDEGKTFLVDGNREFGSVPELEKLGEATGDRYAIEAERLDADLWEVRVAAL